MRKYLIVLMMALVAIVLLTGKVIEATSGKWQPVAPLEEVLKNNRAGNWNGFNSLRKAEEIAVDRGVAASTIVLLLMLPLVATLVSILHYVFGLSGYGIFMPTMIAVAFLATGIIGGLSTFAMILAISLLSNLILKRFKLHFWPARSINLMLITIGMFGLMAVAAYWQIFDISSVSVFPMLFMILLTEEFVRTQLVKSKKEAKNLMLGTLILAVVGAWIMGIREVQEWVLMYPELAMVVGVVANFVVGNYTGMRLTEIGRFRKAIRNKINVKRNK